MEGIIVSYMGSLVYDWLLSASPADKFRKEEKPEPLPPNLPRLADIVKHYKETIPQKRRPSLLSTETQRNRKRWEILIC